MHDLQELTAHLKSVLSDKILLSVYIDKHLQSLCIQGSQRT